MKNKETFKNLWMRCLFRSVFYLLIGLITLIIGYKDSILIMFFGGLMLAIGIVLLTITMISFMKWLVG